MVMLRFLAVAMVSLGLLACSNDQQQQPAETPNEQPAVEGSAVVNAADTSAFASAPSMTLEEANITDIRLNVKQGDSFVYRATQTSNSLQDSTRAVTRSVYIYTMRVKSVRSDGSVEMGMRYDSIGVDIKVMNPNTNQVLMSSNYRSGDTSLRKNPQHAQFNSLLGEEATVIISPKGEIQEISGLSPMVNNLLKAAGPQSQRQPDENTKQKIQQQIEAAMFATVVGQQFVPYPEKQLDAKQTWVREQSTPIGQAFNVDSKTTYTIKDVKNVNGHKVGTIEAKFSGAIRLGTPPPGATTKLVLNRSKITGSSGAVLDLTTGMTVRKDNLVKMDVVATASDPEFGRSKSLAQVQETQFVIDLIR